MQKYLPGLSYVILLVVAACSTPTEQKQQVADPRAQEVVDKAIAYHGGAAYQTAAIGFDFRDKHYTVKRLPDKYVYTRSWQDTIGFVEDILVNSTDLIRKVDRDTVALTQEWAFKYANSVNSVLYFAMLPYGLNDQAVIKKYLVEVTVKGKPYHKVQITFQQQGGGKDFEDVFVYWFDKATYQLDYLAYYYNTDETGIRFREAYNRQTVGGILFQDYINYAPLDSTATVFQTDELLEKGQLKELSRIENENMAALN